MAAQLTSAQWLLRAAQAQSLADVLNDRASKRMMREVALSCVELAEYTAAREKSDLFHDHKVLPDDPSSPEK